MRFLCVMMLSAGLSLPAMAQEAPPVLTVTGTGEVTAEPDMATLSLGVTQLAPTAAAAMQATSDGAAQILAALVATGIARRDLQTQALSLSPNWNNRAYDSGQAPKIDGFIASTTISVHVRDMAVLGNVLDKVIAEGANTFQGMQFSVQEPEPLLDDARRAAVADAMRKAQLYADAAGVSLGPVLSLSEAGNSGPQLKMMEAARSLDGAIAAGEVTMSADVTMVFQIAD